MENTEWKDMETENMQGAETGSSTAESGKKETETRSKGKKRRRFRLLRDVDVTKILFPEVFFPACFVIVCTIVLMNRFVFFPFDGKTGPETLVSGIVQEEVSGGNYTLQLTDTQENVSYRVNKKLGAGETIKGYYDGKHFLSEKQAKKRSFASFWWVIPLSIVIYVALWLFTLRVLKRELGGS